MPAVPTGCFAATGFGRAQQTAPALAPTLKPFADLLGVDEATVKKVLTSWGPGKYDAQLNVDGQAFRPDGKSAAVVLPQSAARGEQIFNTKARCATCHVPPLFTEPGHQLHSATTMPDASPICRRSCGTTRAY